jgi:hypothetical protein
MSLRSSSSRENYEYITSAFIGIHRGLILHLFHLLKLLGATLCTLSPVNPPFTAQEFEVTNAASIRFLRSPTLPPSAPKDSAFFSLLRHPFFMIEQLLSATAAAK